jgi:hypothetical protein
MRATATMGKAIGQNAEHPETFLRKHAKEPVLPQRKFSRTGTTCCHMPSLLASIVLLTSYRYCLSKHQQRHSQQQPAEHVLQPCCCISCSAPSPDTGSSMHAAAAHI